MTKNCQQCQAGFEITDKDIKFYDKISPVINGTKYAIPAPTLCPTCRMQRRLTYRNDRSLYQNRSALSQKKIISMYHPDKGFTVYDQKEWWDQEKWDPLKYGRDFDFNRGFFEQFFELMKVVPRFNVFNRDTENCDFVNYAPHCKNCYLVFGSWFDEDCFYGQSFLECKDCLDGLLVEKSELCYENVDCSNNYHSFFCQNCSHVTDSYFCYDCQNVKNCFGCYNLRNKEYYIDNKPASKEEFKKLVGKLASYKAFLEKKSYYRDVIKKDAIHKSITGSNNENVSGDFIFNCQNAKFCFSAYRCQDIAFVSRTADSKDAYDYEGGGKGELLYESMSNDFGYMSIGCTTCENLKYVHYCDSCFNCNNCFGCIGLQKKQYCIFNKQYSKEDYEDLVGKIIEHMQKTEEWGEFFPASFSPFGYNETMAQDYFPLTKEEALGKGFKWFDYEPSQLEVEKILDAAQMKNLPDNIKDVPDEILDWALTCEASGKLYRITKQELNFYRENNLPIPRRHPDQRHKDRLELRNPRQIFKQNCSKCEKEITTTYSPNRPEKVYCEECYLNEVY